MGTFRGERKTLLAAQSEQQSEREGFRVQDALCSTCIYRPASGFDIKALEAEIADDHMEGYFKAHRTCHHSVDVCCRGFWNKHKDRFTAGQLAQRLGRVVFVHVDNMKKETP